MYEGINIENAAYPVICAERVAIFAVEGEKDFNAIAVVTRNGACRAAHAGR